MKLATIQPDVLTWWEKASAGALFVASGLYAAEWYIGARMPPQIAAALPWIVSVGGLVTLFAIDGALVSTVMGARAGRRSRWTWITIGVSALFGALVALVLHGALPGWVGSWLHAGFMATIAAYLMHLSQPRQDALAELAGREQAVARQAAELGKARQEAEQILAERTAELASREAALAGRTEIVTTEYIEVASARLSWSQFKTIVDKARQAESISLSSLRRLVASGEGE